MNYFLFQNKKYNYFYHEYNQTYKKERIIEIPIVLDYIKQYEGQKILEVGNVLSNYIDCSHDIIDKYDSAKHVIHQDIVDYKPRDKYSLIVSISTIEHIGVEDIPSDPKKVITAIDNMKKMLDINGKIVVTIPMGQNKFLDAYLYRNIIKWNEIYAFKRISRERWIEVSWDDIESNYDHPYGNANELFVGVINESTL